MDEKRCEDNFEVELDKKIIRTRCLKVLNSLLDIKIANYRKSERKLNLSLKTIYEQDSAEIEIICEVITKSVVFLESLNHEIIELINYLNNKIVVTDIYSLQLLSTLILICKSQNKLDLFSTYMDLKKLQKYLITTLLNPNNSSKSYIVTTVFPLYFNIISSEQQQIFLKEIIEIKNLNLLCSFFSKLNLDNKMIFLRNSLFWDTIEQYLSDNDNFMRKHSTFLLSQGIGTIYENFNNSKIISQIPTVLGKFETAEEFQKAWNNFFILLDISQEKHLHLVQPSLKLLKSILLLNMTWRFCIYKMLLRHSQSIIVYSVAVHILNQTYSRNDFKKLISVLLPALNRNEYSDLSKDLFENFNKFCRNLNDKQFETLLERILEVSWNPTAIWCIFNSMFQENNKKNISVELFIRFFNYFVKLPNVYVRRACIQLLASYCFHNNNTNILLNNLTRIIILFKENQKEIDLKWFITNLELPTSVLDYSEFFKENDNFKIVEIQYYVLFEKIPRDSLLKETKDFTKYPPIIVYSYFFEHFDPNTIFNYIVDNLNTVTNWNFSCYETIIKNLMKYDCFQRKLNDIAKQYLSNSPNDYVIHLSLKILECTNDGQVLTEEVFYNDSKKIAETSCLISYINLYLSSKYNEQQSLQIFYHILECYDDTIVSNSMKNLFYLLLSSDDESRFRLIESCYKKVVELRKSTMFNLILLNFISSILNGLYLFDNELYVVEISKIIKDLIVLLGNSNNIVGNYLIKYLNDIVRAKHFYTEKYLIIFTPVIINILLQGTSITKDVRIEYAISQEISRKFETLENVSANFTKTSRSLIVDTLILSRNYKDFVEQFVVCLLEKYKENDKKRHFPDSQIHFEKIRILQILLLLHKHISENTKLEIIDLIKNSFCDIVHTSCARQLMQILLIHLLSNSDRNEINEIIKIINEANKAQPSTISAFIPVLYHLTKLKADEENFCHFIEILLPLTMGPNFKLRVYSQFAILKICDEGRQMNFHQFTQTYTFLEKSVKDVIAASDQNFYDMLKTDREFMETFSPNEHFSITTIFVDIPSLNNVNSMEWEHFVNFKEPNEFCPKGKSFCLSVNKKLPATCSEFKETIMEEESTNIQRKITPWKFLLQEDRGNEKIGDLILIASLIDKPSNLGGLSRTCEIFGVKHLVLNDAKLVQNKEFTSLSMSSENWVNVIECKIDDLPNFITSLRVKNNYAVVGAEQTSDSCMLQNFKFEKKTVLLLGNEKEGIPPQLILLLDHCVEIPQVGFTRSLNVHVAGATFIWEYTKQHIT